MALRAIRTVVAALLVVKAGLHRLRRLRALSMPFCALFSGGVPSPWGGAFAPALAALTLILTL